MDNEKLFTKNFYMIENEILIKLNTLVSKNIISQEIADNAFNRILFLNSNLFSIDISSSDLKSHIDKTICTHLVTRVFDDLLDYTTINSMYEVLIYKSLDIKNDVIIQLINISDLDICYINNFLKHYNLID